MIKSWGLRRWAWGKDNREASKSLLLGTGALRPPAGMVARDPKENSVSHLLIQHAFTATGSVCRMERQDRDSPQPPTLQKSRRTGTCPSRFPGAPSWSQAACKTSSAPGGSPRGPVSPHPSVSSPDLRQTHSGLFTGTTPGKRFACDLQKLGLRLTSTQLFAAQARPPAPAPCPSSA